MNKGRILPDDIAALRARVAIEDIISERVTLRRSGSGMTGLCPFHDETSPSFNVSPGKGLYNCFGCQESGDVITFVQKTDGLTFVEAVERLADKVGFTLRYSAPDANYVAPPPGQRTRLIEANKTATAFYRHALRHDPAAALGMAYLTERGFSDDAIDQFGIGYAPARDSVTAHLKSKGFTEDEVVTAGIAGRSDDGRVYDRFRARLIWPIKDLSGEVIGFGARRLSEDDKGPKWLNTPDTPLYKKSEVLYGIDTARKSIAQERTVVVVEGYGDVMACHLSGVPYAVATCGTSFGDGHIRIVRRLLRDDEAYAGKVIFTFDGDAAGQKAALRAFKENNRFASQTFVAVAPQDMDPLDLRIAQGDEAVRSLVATAVPLVEFALKSTLTNFDLTLSEGRVNALKALAPLLAGIKDVTMRSEYMRRVSGWLALPERSVSSAVTYAARQASGQETPQPQEEIDDPVRTNRPDPHDSELRHEREMLKALLQLGHPSQVMPHLMADLFTHPVYRDAFTALDQSWQADPRDENLLEAVRAATHGTPVESVIGELAVEPVRNGSVSAADYQQDVANRLLDRDAERRITDLKVQLASANGDTQGMLLSVIMTLEQFRRSLR
jgi:DNA primase